MLSLFSVYHFEKTFRKLNNVLRELCLYQHLLIYFTIWVLVINILFVSAVTSKKEKWIKQKNEKANNINNPKSGNQKTWLIVFEFCSSFWRCT